MIAAVADDGELFEVFGYSSPVFQEHSLNDAARWINARDSSAIAIGAAHGTVERVSQDVVDYPCCDCERAALNSVMLG